ncbi:MAG: hypothetical protein COB30_012120 [Ectothiorhodospiraceae bacterium]|nr:hypothetical protein [Ectothiorhodospiraceae bacterium]
MKMHLYVVKYFVVLVFLSGCSFNSHLKSVPIEDEDFSLEPAEIVKKFSDIRRFDEQYGVFAPVPLKELEDVWGKPSRINKILEKESYVRNTHFVGGLLMLFGSSTLLLGIGGGVMLFTPDQPPPEEYIWEKGGYTIISTIYGPNDKRKLSSWNWEYQNFGDSGSVIEHIPLPTWFYSLGYSRGGSGYSNTINIDDLKAGLGIHLSVGRLLKVPLKNMHLQLSAGLKLGGKFEASERQAATRRVRTSNYIFGVVPIYRWPDSKWLAGAGVTYYTASTIEFDFRENEPLGDKFGAVTVAEYALSKRATLGVRLDFINQKTPSGINYDGSSLGLYAKSFF